LLISSRVSSLAAAQSEAQSSSTGLSPTTVLSNQMSSSSAPTPPASSSLPIVSSNVGTSYQASVPPASVALTSPSSSCTLWAYPSAPGTLAFQASSAPGAQCAGWTTFTLSATQTEGNWNATATETVNGQTATPQFPWMGSGQTTPPMGSTTPLVVPLPSSTTSNAQSMGMGVGVKHAVALLVCVGALMLMI